MRQSVFSLAFLTLLSLIIAPAHADYLIELIIFEPTSQQGWLDEYWPLLPAKLDRHDKDQDLGSSTATNRHLLNETHFTLKEIAKRLTSTGEYKIVSHTAWTQPAESRQSGYTWLPEGSSRTGLPLQAKIRFYKQKFEHIDIEIQLERKIPADVISALAEKKKLSPADIGDSWRFMLQDSRKTKPNDLHYFDHPMFGALLTVRNLSVN
jgi:hypothetical protein